MLEEGNDKRFGKNNPGRHNDTSDESKVKIHELRGELRLMDDGIVGWAVTHCCTFLGLHAVNVGPGRGQVYVVIIIIIIIIIIMI